MACQSARFMGMSRPVAASTSSISNDLVRSRAPSSDLILFKRDLTNSPDPAHAVQGRSKPSTSNNLVIFSHIKLFAWRQGFKKPSNGVREKELSRLPGNKAREIPFVPAIFSVLGTSKDVTPCQGVKMYELTFTLCQPLFLSYFRCPWVLSGIKC
jgi:hypothetical protein